MRRSLVPLVVGAAAALEEVRVVGFLEGLTDALAAHYAREGAVLKVVLSRALRDGFEAS